MGAVEDVHVSAAAGGDVEMGRPEAHDEAAGTPGFGGHLKEPRTRTSWDRIRIWRVYCLMFVLGFILISTVYLALLRRPGAPTVWSPLDGDGKCEFASGSFFIRGLCLLKRESSPSLMINFSPLLGSLLLQPSAQRPLRVLVSSLYSLGTEENDHTASVYHLTSTDTNFNVFTFAFPNRVDSSQDPTSSLAVSKLALATRTYNPNYTTANIASSFTGTLCELPRATTAENGWYVIDELVANLFYIIDTPYASDEDRRIVSIDVKGFAVHVNNTRVDLIVRRGQGTRTTSQAISFSLTLLPMDLHTSREASDAVGYFTSAFAFADAPPALRKRRDRTVRIINTRRNFAYYLDPSVPYDLRPAVKQGVLNWNLAFQSAGLGSPLRVIDPDDPDWPKDYNAGDAFITSISWSVSLDYTFAIAPSIIDPMTGEILSSNIVVSTNWPSNWELQDLLLDGKVQRSHRTCLKRHLADIVSENPDADARIVAAGLTDVVQHEVGHSLGLRHNFKGSAAIPFEKLGDDAYIQANGIGSSVMDYVARNYFAQTQFSPRIGSYDVAAIAYGYRKLSSASASNEQHVLTLSSGQKIELRDHPELVSAAQRVGPFVTDEDLVVDPYASDFDLSDEPLLYFSDSVNRIANAIATAEASGVPHYDDFYGPLMRMVRRSCLYSLKHLGGRVVGSDGRIAFVDTDAQKSSLSMALQVAVNGTFSGRRVFPTADFVKQVGDCEGVEQYCFGRQVRSTVISGWNVRAQVFKAILEPSRLERMAEQPQPGLRWMLDTVFEAVWGAKFNANLREPAFESQRLWVKTVVSVIGNLTSVPQANLKMDCAKLDDLIRSEAPFASSVVKSHFALLISELKEAKLVESTSASAA